MSILQDVSEITGHNETECFILLCMQSCGADFNLTDEGAAKDNVNIAYIAQAEDEVAEYGDKSRLPE
jgi:hypothetical protein